MGWKVCLERPARAELSGSLAATSALDETDNCEGGAKPG